MTLFSYTLKPVQCNQKVVLFPDSHSGIAVLVFQFSSGQLLTRVRLFATPLIAACQASLSIANSQSSPKLMCIKSVMLSSHLILCRPLLLLPPIPPSIRVFSNELTLCMRWPKYWSFSLSISPLNFSKSQFELFASQGLDSHMQLVATVLGGACRSRSLADYTVSSLACSRKLL